MKKIYNLLDTKKIERISFRTDINGLRAVAVLSVILHHAEFKFISGGWLGVDIFFVISGFLISNIIISELNTGNFKFKEFYIRRIRRIIPGLFSTLLITIPFAYWLLIPKTLKEYVDSLVSSIFFYANLYFRDLDFYNASGTKVMPLLHTWSLAIEEQFYIIFPLLCWVIFRYFRNFIFYILSFIFLLSIYLNSTTNYLVKFYEIQFRAWELLFGALIMILYGKVHIKHVEKIGLMTLLFSIFYFDDTMLTLNSIEPKLVATIGTGLTLLGNKSEIPFKILDNKFFMLMGNISFSAYLLHQPIFAFTRVAIKRNILTNSEYLYEVLIIVIVFLAYLNWKYIEKTFQNTSVRNLTIFVFLSMFILISFIFVSSQSNYFSDRFDYVPEEVLYYSTSSNIYPLTYDNSDYKFQESNCDNKIMSYRYCTFYNTNSSNRIILVGDSHANALSVSFLVELESLKSDFNLLFFPATAGRCILSQQSDTLGYVEECSEQFYNNFINLLNKENDIVVTFGRYNTWISDKGKRESKCEDCDHIDVITDRFSTISENSKHLIIIEPIPTYKIPVAESYLNKVNVWGTPVTKDLKNWEIAIQDTDMLFKKLNGENIKFVSTIEVFCNLKGENKCYASDENNLYYSDTNHLTLTGANLITNKVEELINDLK